MNFLGLPFGSNALLITAIVSMVVIPVGMFAYFRYRRWL